MDCSWPKNDLGWSVEGISVEYWHKGKEYNLNLIIKFCIVECLKKDTTKKLWENFGNLYQLKYLVNKLFLQNKLYLLRIGEGDLVIDYLTSFNSIISKILFVDIKIIEEEKCVSLLFSLSDSWDSLVMAIGNNNTTLNIYDVVESLLL